MTKNFKCDRQKCLICKHDKLKTFIEYTMPVFMGAVDKFDFIKTDMKFDICLKCKNVQIKSEISPKILYAKNHNIGIIGNLWKFHYEKFSKFIRPSLNRKQILEISDPSAKLAIKNKNYECWTIVKPNPTFKENKKIKIIKDFFDENFKTQNLYDVIIHSHFMEHSFDPNQFIKKCNLSLKDNGIMFISIPNLQYLLNNNYTPNNILHFEHTYYYDDKTLKYLLNNNGFKIEKIEKYKNHSIFYRCKKVKNIKVNANFKADISIKNKFKNLHKKHLTKIKNINKKIKTNKNKKYLFGCHVSSQYYIYNGLFKIDGILDNSKHKQGKILYGTEYRVFPVETLKSDKNPIVICSGLGPYKKEIIKQIKNINSKAIIL